MNVPTTSTPATQGKRYCWACEAYTNARVCKPCGMPTERVPRADAAPDATTAVAR